MADLIRVMAVRGKMQPHPTAQKAFVGYEVVHDVGQADHVVPDGLRYRIKPDGELIQNTVMVRRAIRRGDIAEFQAPPAAVAESAPTQFLFDETVDAPSEG
jgi:hypothetical protein